MSTLSSELDRYSQFSPDLMASPYPLYHRMRAEDPVHWSSALGGWMLTRYADVVAGFRDRRLSADRMPAFMGSLSGPERESVNALERQMESMLSNFDGPDHTRLRSLVSKAFTPRVVARVQERVASLTDAMIDAVVHRGEMDLIADLAFPLPATIVSELVGIPAEDRVKVKRWADDFAEFQTASRAMHDRALRAQASLAELREYISRIAEMRQTEPRQDLISELVRAEQDGDRLSSEELVSTVALILIAGNETTTNLIANGMLALLRNEDQLARLRRDRELMGSAVEELLRFDAPLQRSYRTALEDFDLHGRQIEAGQTVSLVMGAANRDPEEFDEPDVLDIGRSPNRHIAFGHGAHFCIGAPLARMEAVVVLGKLLDRFPRFRLGGGSLEYRPMVGHRGLRSLPLVFG